MEKQAEEKEIEMKLSRGMKDKHTSKRPRTKSSLFGREMIEFDGENEGSQVISNNVNSSGMFQNEKDKKKRELGFIFKKIVLNNIDQELSEKSEISTSNGLLQISSNHVVT